MLSIYDSRLILTYFIIVAALFGAVMGSFLNCLAWRVTHGESVLKGRSHCPNCGHTLGVSELIPVFSWLFQRGRCKACGEKISIRYPLTELFFAAVTVLCLLRFDLTIECLRNYIFLCCLFALSLTDLESMVIPNGFHIVMLAVWILALPFVPGFRNWPEIIRSLIAFLVYGGGILGLSLLMDKLLKKDSLGGGDVKLIAVAALYLGLIGMLFAMLLASVIGLVYVLVKRFAGARKSAEEGEEKASETEAEASGSERQEAGSEELRSGRMEAAGEEASEAETDLSDRESKGIGEFPFGPAIAAACALVLLYGGAVINWYLGLIG